MSLSRRTDNSTWQNLIIDTVLPTSIGGSAAAPAIGLSTDSTTGFYNNSGAVAISNTGVNDYTFGTSILTNNAGQYQCPGGGSAGAPAYSFSGTSGLYNNGGNPAISRSGLRKFEVSATGIGCNGSSSAATPSLYALGDTTTGLYNPAASQVGITLGGTSTTIFSATTTTSTVPYTAPNGNAGAPGFTFASSSTMGMYYNSGNLAFTVQGTRRMQLSTTGLGVINETSAATPSLFSLSESNTGIYFPAAGQYGISILGTNVATYTATGFLSAQPLVGPAGAVGAPAYTTTGDLDTGVYFPAANTVAISAGGTNQLQVDGSKILSNQVFQAPSGGLPNPSYSFSADTLTGMYRSGSSTIGFECAGSLIHSIAPLVITTANGVQFQSGSGSVGTPTYSFTSDSDTGIYNPSANWCSIATGGVDKLDVGSTYTNFVGQPCALYNHSTTTGVATATGMIYFDTASGGPKFYDGTTWRTIGFT